MGRKAKRRICEFAYSRAEVIGMTGAVAFCCSDYTNYYSLGNLHEQTFEEIWNGERARKVRQSMLDGTFEYCNVDKCCENECLLIPAPKGCTTVAPPPKTVEIGVSSVCNCLCTMCKNNYKLEPEEYDPAFYDNMRVKYLQILKHAETLSLNNYGECFVDKNCKRLIKYGLAINKNLKLKILTNGVYADEKHFIDYGIMNNVSSISVSIHAATKETYDSIVINGNFEKVRNNLEWLAKMKKDGKLEEVIINFTVQQKNYHEMVDFAKWAERLDIICEFWEVRLNDGNANIWDKVKDEKYLKEHKEYDVSEYYKAAVHLPEHPEHEKLKAILKNKIFKKEFCLINDLLLNL